ncbi:MAG: GGDEF domain-containing protein [Lachnospiraceae bacterium]|nr:GGDEF domain-containing protein [Lachnospiraceae bacterium]
MFNKRFLVNLKSILTGNLAITDRQKYSVIIYSVALVHLFLTCLFGYFKVKPLFIFNIISVLTYLSCTRLINKDIFLLVYYITYLEIVLHSFVATICVGWQYGFAQYLIAIIPVCYYMCYTMNTKHRKIVIATGSALFAVLAFLSCKVLSFYFVPIYELHLKSLELILYIFNSICTFLFLIIFSLTFVFEMNLSSKQLRHQNAILDKLASTDPLTGLYNRRSMDVFLTQALKSGSSFSVIMCDIDNFKKINDSYGHDFGDIVLREIARITTDQVKGNGYVCRWGGEEILILISNLAKEKVCRIAEDIRRNVANHVFQFDTKWIRCTLTLGISTHDKQDTIEETITKADYNLYVGKRNGKNVVIY